MKLTQQGKILEMYKTAEWVCQKHYWESFIFSPHKRRDDLVKTKKYRFEDRPCEHGLPNSFDYKLIRLTEDPQETLFPPAEPKSTAYRR